VTPSAAIATRASGQLTLEAIARTLACDVVILDNLGSHKGKAVRRAIRNVGARLVFLPKYSPDLNPIEQVFAKFKTLLRKAGARSYEALSQACAQILTQYPPEECAAYIRNAGYA
jgi:putative transposase